MIKLLLQLAHCCFVISAAAQSNHFITYNKSSGLPDDNVTCMLTDSRGFIWVGTFNGLSRYDGTHFYNFPQGSFESNQLAGDIILDLEETEEFIWVAHRFGISRINKYNFVSKNYQNQEAGSVYNLRRAIRDIYKDENGNLWLAGDHQLLKFDAQKKALVTIADFEKILPKSSPTQLNKIIKSGEYELMLFVVKSWYKYNTKLNKLDTASIDAVPIKLLQGQNLRVRSYWNTFVSDFFVDVNERNQTISIGNASNATGVAQALNVYVDSSHSVIVCSEQNKVTVLNSYNNIQIRQHIAFQSPVQAFNFIHYSNTVCCVGSIKGLRVTNRSSQYLKKYYLSKDASGIAKDVGAIMDVQEFGFNELLVATRGGLYILNQENASLTSLPGWKDSAIYQTLVLPDKSIWISTDKNLWHFNPSTGKRDKPIWLETYAMTLRYHSPNIIAGTRSDGLVILNTNNKVLTRVKQGKATSPLLSNRITAIEPIDNAGNFIITFNDLPGAYSYFNVEKNQYKPDSIPKTAYSFKERFSIHSVRTAYRQLWFGNYLGGAQLYDSSTGTWTNFTMHNGMGNNTVFDIERDAKNRTWLLTDNGIDVYDAATKRVFNFPVHFLSGGRKGGFVHSSGKLIFFDKESVAEIEPAKFSLTAPKRSILLSYIKQGDKQFLVAQPKLQLPYNSNSFSINFSLQKWDAHYLVNYAYRLSDNDNWKEIGGETQLNFAALQPGSYQLQIKATDELGQWSYYSKPFEIMVNPPFWKTWWFRLLALISIIALLRYVIVRKQKQKIKQLQHQNEIMRLNAEKETGIARERERIIADLHDDVGATLSSLNIYGQLAEKVWNDKPEESRSLVNKIATTASALMGRMGDIIWSMKIVEEEKFSLESRLKNYCTELLSPKNMESNFQIDNQLAATITHPELKKNILLIAKEAINNTAKYSEASKVIISLQNINEAIVLSVTDNGRGFNTQKIIEGNGLKNMKQRTEQLGGRFLIAAPANGGTAITCIFPVAIFSHANNVANT